MISLSKMKVWFEEETENSVRKIRSEIEKRINYVKESMEELVVASKDFEVGDTVDAETRSSQNIFEKMIEMVEGFEYPEVVTYKTADEFAKSLKKFLERVMEIGRRFIPNLKKKYKTRVFILNRALQRIQRNYQELNNFLEEKTVLLREVDETSDKISLIISKVKERESLKEQIKEETLEAEKITDEINELDNSTSNLESKTVLSELDEINKEVHVIGNKLKLHLGGFDKPLRKLTSRAQDGKIMVPPDLVQMANLLKENPLEVLWEQPEGHERLNDLMEILVEVSKNDKIQLKTAMKNKAISLADEIIAGSLKEIHNELMSHKSKKQEIELRVEELGLKDQIHHFKEKQEELIKSQARKNRAIKDLKNKLEELNNDIVNYAAETQRQIRKLTNQDVKINIKE